MKNNVIVNNEIEESQSTEFKFFSYIVVISSLFLGLFFEFKHSDIFLSGSIVLALVFILNLIVFSYNFLLLAYSILVLSIPVFVIFMGFWAKNLGVQTLNFEVLLLLNCIMAFSVKFVIQKKVLLYSSILLGAFALFFNLFFNSDSTFIGFSVEKLPYLGLYVVLVTMLFSSKIYLGKYSTNDEVNSLKQKVEDQELMINNLKKNIDIENQNLEKYTTVILNLNKDYNIRKGNLENSLQKITKVATQTIKTSRISIWEFDKNRGKLKCICLYNGEKNIFETGLELSESEYSKYFDMIEKKQIVKADSVFENEATNCFIESYFVPNHIFSMLDIPYFIESSLAGVVCCEHQYEFREWSNDDIFFIKSIADLVSISFETNNRKKMEEKVMLQKEEILAKNEELKLQKKAIQEINDSLEEKILERTLKLEQKNSQLQEYTYVNSHLLRGPLCRILGLIYILENKMFPEGAESDFVTHLKDSASELDEMIKSLTKKLEEETNFDITSIVDVNRFSKN